VPESEQVDQNMAASNEEQVVAGLLKVALALLRGGVVQRLDALDAERFDDGAHGNFAGKKGTDAFI